jgi:glutamyl-tRNA synthetase
MGSARTALFNVLVARQGNGSVVLRLDDTDVERNRPEYETAVYEGLRWIGFDWDEGPDVGGRYGPYRQSERMDLYREQAARLLQSGAAYRCFCTPEELEAERQAARARGVAYRYSRRCLTNPPQGREEFVVRLQIPPGETIVRDAIRGDVPFENELIGDPVLVRSNGTPLYNFSSTIDDALMGISHVIRGEEHLPNTPIQLMLFDAMAIPRPELFAHVPVIVGKDRKKLSKRLHPEMKLDTYQQQGYLPEAVLNYLALLGWNPGTEKEIFTFDELVREFSLDRVQNSPAMFDWDKLDWVNGVYIRGLSDDELARRLRPFLPDLPEGTIRAAAPALKERLPHLDRARDLLGYLVHAPEPPRLDSTQREMVSAAERGLTPTAWTPDAVEQTLEQVREQRGWGRGKFFNPIRLAVAGGDSPPIHYTLALLPKDEALNRLRRAAA